MADCTSAPRRPRDRILGTARDLFRQCGIRGTGVDTIAETAGTNKMTLYRHFHSKDDLIIACLQQAATDAQAAWTAVETDHPDDPMAQLHGWVRIVGHVLRGDRGCEVANAAVELPEAGHPVRSVIAGFKTEQRERLVGLCRSAGIAEADILADTLSLMVEGARVSRQTVGENGPSERFVECAEAAVAFYKSRSENAAASGSPA